MWAMPKTLAYRLMIFLPIGAMGAYTVKQYYDSGSDDGKENAFHKALFGKPKGEGGAVGKSWY